MFYFPKLGTYSSSPLLNWKIPGSSCLKACLLGISNTAYSKIGLIISYPPYSPPGLSAILHAPYSVHWKPKISGFSALPCISIQAIKKFCWFWSLDMSYLSSLLCTSYLLLSWPLISLVDSNSSLSKNDLQSIVPLRVWIDQNWMVFSFIFME